MSFLGHKIAKDEKSIQDRNASATGYIKGDEGILNELGILRNTKINAQPGEIRDFLHWLIGNRSPPLPPLARRVLCRKRALIKMSISATHTSNAQRTAQNQQIAEIDEILKRDGLDSETIEDEERCSNAPSSFKSTPVTPVPAPAPAPAPTPAPAPAPASPEPSGGSGGNSVAPPSTVMGAGLNRRTDCPPPVLQCICNGGASSANIQSIRTQIQSLETLIRQIQTTTGSATTVPGTASATAGTSEPAVAPSVTPTPAPETATKDELIAQLLARIEALIGSVNDPSNQKALKNFTNEVLQRLESMYKLLVYKKEKFEVLFGIVQGLLGKEITKEDLDEYLKTEEAWKKEIETELRKRGEDDSKITEILLVFASPTEDQKQNPKDFLEMRRDILTQLIHGIFTELLIVKEKSCDEEVAEEKKKCQDKDEQIDKLRQDLAEQIALINTHEGRIRDLEQQLKDCNEGREKNEAERRNLNERRRIAIGDWNERERGYPPSHPASPAAEEEDANEEEPPRSPPAQPTPPPAQPTPPPAQPTPPPAQPTPPPAQRAPHLGGNNNENIGNLLEEEFRPEQPTPPPEQPTPPPEQPTPPPETRQPFLPPGPTSLPAKPRPEPKVRPRTTRSFIDDLRSSQTVKRDIIQALKVLFTNARDKKDIKNELQEMLTYLTNYYFATSVPEENPNTIDIINKLLTDERYHNILVNPTGDEIINISMDAALQRKVSPRDITSWDASQGAIQPEDDEATKSQKYNYTKIMVKKLILYLLNEAPQTYSGGRHTRRKNKKSQRKTRRRRA